MPRMWALGLVWLVGCKDASPCESYVDQHVACIEQAGAGAELTRAMTYDKICTEEEELRNGDLYYDCLADAYAHEDCATPDGLSAAESKAGACGARPPVPQPLGCG